jgi:hypothetical protein
VMGSRQKTLGWLSASSIVDLGGEMLVNIESLLFSQPFEKL